MPDLVPSIPLQLDRLRHVRLRNEALCDAEDDLSVLRGQDMSVYDALLQAPMRLNDLSIILYHGLKHEDESLTLADVKRLMNHAPMPTILQAVTEAWTWHTQAAERQEGATQPDPPPAVPRGDGSGPLPVLNLGSPSASSGS